MRIAIIASILVWSCGPGVSAQSPGAPGAQSLETASQIVRWSGSSGGVCAVVGRTDAELALAIAKQGSFVVHCLYAEPTLRDKMRQVIRSHGMYGTVSAGTLQRGRLPYAENLVNIVVVDSYPALVKNGFSADEVLRVLAPLGTAFLGASSTSAEPRAWTEELTARLRSLGVKDLSVVETGGTWVRMRKPWPADIDEWTHYLHGPDGNPVARDRVVGPPEHYQWISDPLWQRCHETDSSVSTLVTAGVPAAYGCVTGSLSVSDPDRTQLTFWSM